ncbi:MAG: preprotein translocase subunit SecE [Candidatus Saccharimonas sp.]
MAKANKTTRSTKQDEPKVTRIKASDSTPKKRTNVTAAPATKSTTRRTTPRVKNPLAPLVRYVKGSWYELRQVRWPDRRSTWGMTGALLVFTLFFVVVILLLDAGFQQLFKLIIGK